MRDAMVTPSAQRRLVRFWHRAASPAAQAGRPVDVALRRASHTQPRRLLLAEVDPSAASPARVLGMRGSPDTLLLLIRTAPLPAGGDVQVLALDDWSATRGRIA
jgi:hypothetical protein